MRGRLRSYLERCERAFYKPRGYSVADRILEQQFGDYPRNRHIVSVRTKVVLLNQLYRTNVFDDRNLSLHINRRGRGIDTYLREGSLRAVERIRRGHGIRHRGGTELDLYSFATKYCHWHRPNIYPIFDRYVTIALRELNRPLNFLSRFSVGSLRDYPFFKTVVDSCRRDLRIRWGYRRFDHALWFLGQVIAEDDDGFYDELRPLPRDLR